MKRISYSQNERGHYYYRWVYDITYFIFIDIITMNIMFGIIIENFESLREESHRLHQDIENTCFICSLPRTNFDNIPNGFEIHKTQEHSTKNYIYFLYNVRYKPQRNLMGIELYVHELKNDKMTSWLPLLRSLRLSHSVEYRLEERLKVLHEKFVALRKSLQFSN